MSPTSPQVVAQLRHLIYYHLDNNMLQNALFTAGRLIAHDSRSPEATFLVALCHLRLGELKAAYEYSRSAGSRGTHLGCAYVFAQACHGLDRHYEGIRALEYSKSLWVVRNSWNKHSESLRRHLPDAAAVYCLMGKLWSSYGELKKAVECFVEALTLNPFMWDAFLGLCDTGAAVRVQNAFKLTPERHSIMASSINTTDLASGTEEDLPSHGPLRSQPNNQSLSGLDPFSTKGATSAGFADLFTSGTSWFHRNDDLLLNGEVSAMEGLETPSGPVVSIDADSLNGAGIPGNNEPPHAPSRRNRTLQGLGLDLNLDATSKSKPSLTKSRTRSRLEEDTAEALGMSRNVVAPASSLSAAVGERKRSASGQAPPTAAHTHAIDPTVAPQRRSKRLFNQIRPTSSKVPPSTSSSISGPREGRDPRGRAQATGTRGRSGTSGSTVGRVVSGNRKVVIEADIDLKESAIASKNATAAAAAAAAAAQALATNNEIARREEAIRWLLELFKKCAAGYYSLVHYQCSDALQIFNSIPTVQRETPWVLSQMGRALYEQAAYTEADRYFVKVRSIAPTRLDDLEIYSTILWHLKRDVDLAFLAHSLCEIQRLSPQAWCAVGNSFSLQRDHDQALKCFKRATQLNPKFAYAHTLQGHEHVENEEFDKALLAYRNAISADNRHYNAWYGLGKVYEKIGKYEIAEKHYRTASGVNPTNAVLLCSIGAVLEKLKNPRGALLQYAKACELAPQSALARYRKARTLMNLQEPHLALAELKILKDVAADEANVHFLLGKVYKILSQKASAIRHFTIALNLDPKAGQHIKEAIESLEEDDDLELETMRE
ncbi:MAG: anaphase-promoting complex subunit cdc27 [Trizodia sp. TS-e1964]|nr:MAG: anaphase-promoting complex subunit cdc27 [Trizodia sp. TS-e1964]